MPSRWIDPTVVSTPAAQKSSGNVASAWASRGVASGARRRAVSNDLVRHGFGAQGGLCETLRDQSPIARAPTRKGGIAEVVFLRNEPGLLRAGILTIAILTGTAGASACSTGGTGIALPARVHASSADRVELVDPAMASARRASRDHRTFPRIRWRRSIALGTPWDGRLADGVRLPREGRSFFIGIRSGRYLPTGRIVASAPIA
jgi:hypothetical protein